MFNLNKYGRQLVMLMALVCLLSSCTIREEITFNKDFSGSRKLTFDMSDYINTLSLADDDKDLTDEFNKSFEKRRGKLDSTILNYQQMPGVHNPAILIDSINYLMGISYDFDNIAALNRSYRGMMNVEDIEVEGMRFGEEPEKVQPDRVVLIGNKLTFEDERMDMSDGNAFNLEKLQEEDKMKRAMSYFTKSFDYEVTLRFKRKVDRVMGYGVEKVDAKTVRAWYNFLDLQKEDAVNKITVVFK